MKNSNENWNRFGRWVAQKREEIGLSQFDLAVRIGRDRQTIYRIENGIGTKRPTVVKIAEALGQLPSTALDIAFGAIGKELSTIPQEGEILGYLKDLLPEQREFMVIILRAVAASNRNKKQHEPVEFENAPDIDGSDAPESKFTSAPNAKKS